MAQAAEQTEIFGEVLIVGGGVSALTMALAAAQAGFSAILADSSQPSQDKPADSRAFAVAPASMQLFSALGLSAAIASGAEPVLRMAIADSLRAAAGDSVLRLDFSPLDGSGSNADPLAYIIEHQHLLSILRAAAAQASGLRLLDGRQIAGLDQKPGAIRARFAAGGSAEAQLIIAADGRASKIRTLSALDGNAWDYDQTAIAATIAHSGPHQGAAHDFFFPSGPLGVLPLRGERSSIVWCEKPAAAQALMALEPDAFCAELDARLGGMLGRLRLEGVRAAFPLSMFAAHAMIAPRAALIGDAAHAVHPLAGQGLNIGLRDIAALADTLTDARALGLDIGAETTLERYQRWRRFDNLSYAAAFDGLNRAFALRAPPLRALRSAGLAAANSIGGLRAFFAREASGVSESAPRLLRGEPLTPLAA